MDMDERGSESAAIEYCACCEECAQMESSHGISQCAGQYLSQKSQYLVTTQMHHVGTAQ